MLAAGYLTYIILEYAILLGNPILRQRVESLLMILFLDLHQRSFLSRPLLPNSILRSQKLRPQLFY